VIEDIEDKPESTANHGEERGLFEEKYFYIAAEFETLIKRKLTAQMFKSYSASFKRRNFHHAVVVPRVIT